MLSVTRGNSLHHDRPHQDRSNNVVGYTSLYQSRVKTIGLRIDKQKVSHFRLLILRPTVTVWMTPACASFVARRAGLVCARRAGLVCARRAGLVCAQRAGLVCARRAGVCTNDRGDHGGLLVLELLR